MSAERNCFNVVNLRGEFVDIGAPHMGSHGQDGAVHITGYNRAKIHMESETKHVAGTQIVKAKDNNSDVIFSTDNGNRTLGFDANCTVDFNNCTVQNLAGGGGGAVSDPLNLNNINAAVAITTQSIAPLASGGGLVIRANGLQAPAGAGETLNISASTVETIGGDIYTTNGNVRVQGTGFISSNTTIASIGKISTGVAGDMHSGRDFIFNGQDIYKSYPGVVPEIPNKTYKDYKGLVATGDNAIFTGEPIFRRTIKVQTSDGAVPPALTDQITLNSNGTIQCANVNIGAALTVGTITCDNGGTNECKARVFNTRTSGTNGWTIKQALEDANPPQNAANNILQFAATQAQAAGIPTQIYVTASDFDPSQGDKPSVIIDPVTTASGGRVLASQFITGTTDSRFVLKQDVSGPLINHLQINASDASSEVRFRDNGGQSVLRVGKTAVTLGNTIPLNFGGLSFRPQQYTLSRTLTIAANADTTNFTNMAFNCRSDTWTDVNTGGSVSMYNALLEGYYKCTITQTGSSSSAGNFILCDIMFDYVYHMSTQTDPDITITEPTYGYRKKPTNQARPTIEIDHFNTPVQSQPVFVLYSGQNSGETMTITVRLTKMPY